MEYEYTANDRLQVPHTYMYSRFAGPEFLAQYKSDRLSRLSSIARSRIETSSLNEALTQRALINFLVERADSTPAGFDFTLCRVRAAHKHAMLPRGTFSLDETVDTSILMDYLLYRLLNDRKEQAGVSEAQLWIDRLVQRFEVSKKLWSQYLAGFRKGRGSDTDLNIYYRFALLLSLAYIRSGGLQYLNALLKVNDLLLSLPTSSHTNRPHCSLVLAVAIELCAVENLTPASEAKNGSTT